MNELALFAGAGGGILAGHLLGWRTVCAVEYEPYAAAVLIQRQNDGILRPFPVWDDVRTFDGHPWRGRVDVVSGGFPCQDISAAGRGEGITGERSGLWKEMARIIREVGPRFVFVENSPRLTNKGLGVVLGDLASMGFNAEWGVYGSIDAELPSLRERLWIVASSMRNGLEGKGLRQTSGKKLGRQKLRSPKKASDVLCQFLQRFDASGIHGNADGLAGWVERLKATGNGQVPAVAVRAWEELTARISA
ncbi:MAG: DNA cytosine methyltransferase [Spartobacteria bacterium]|nr:DNA cytosine methyltransferase [Spartobacteria bacterium]